MHPHPKPPSLWGLPIVACILGAIYIGLVSWATYWMVVHLRERVREGDCYVATPARTLSNAEKRALLAREGNGNPSLTEVAYMYYRYTYRGKEYFSNVVGKDVANRPIYSLHTLTWMYLPGLPWWTKEPFDLIAYVDPDNPQVATLMPRREEMPRLMSSLLWLTGFNAGSVAIVLAILGSVWLNHQVARFLKVREQEREERPRATGRMRMKLARYHLGYTFFLTLSLASLLIAFILGVVTLRLDLGTPLALMAGVWTVVLGCAVGVTVWILGLNVRGECDLVVDFERRTIEMPYSLHWMRRAVFPLDDLVGVRVKWGDPFSCVVYLTFPGVENPAVLHQSAAFICMVESQGMAVATALSQDLGVPLEVVRG